MSSAGIRKRGFVKRGLVVLAVFTLSHPGFANELHVPSQYGTIQAAIDAATDGDTVLVWGGVYSEEISFEGKAITIASADELAVLEAPGGYAVSLYQGEGRDSVLKNFIIRNSYTAVFLTQASPTLRNLTVVDNDFGIAAYVESEPVISSSIFYNNSGGDLFGCEARYSLVGGDTPALFVDAANGDYHLRSERGRYWAEHDIRILDDVTSPGVDGGEPGTDVGAEPEPNGGRINMGAYGGTAYASMTPRQASCLGDLNRDDWMSPADIGALISILYPHRSSSYWVQCP